MDNLACEDLLEPVKDSRVVGLFIVWKLPLGAISGVKGSACLGFRGYSETPEQLTLQSTFSSRFWRFTSRVRWLPYFCLCWG